jgi:hypothetical protein
MAKKRAGAAGLRFMSKRESGIGTRRVNTLALRAILGVLLVWSVVARGEQPFSANQIVLAVANEYRNGGGFNWGDGSGTPEEIRFKGSRILSKGKQGTYCCGFTFAVAMKAASRAGLLEDKSVAQIRRFQREWYGATPASADRQCALAVETLKIGKEVKLAEAQPGDFLRLWRTTCGHNLILLRWIVEGGKRVGIEYRGTQDSTDGIGNATEYFKGAPGHDGTIDLKKTHVARLLNRPEGVRESAKK